jgi:hypothetical protein
MRAVRGSEKEHERRETIDGADFQKARNHEKARNH